MNLKKTGQWVFIGWLALEIVGLLAAAALGTNYGERFVEWQLDRNKPSIEQRTEDAHQYMEEIQNVP